MEGPTVQMQKDVEICAPTSIVPKNCNGVPGNIMCVELQYSILCRQTFFHEKGLTISRENDVVKALLIKDMRISIESFQAFCLFTICSIEVLISFYVFAVVLGKLKYGNSYVVQATKLSPGAVESFSTVASGAVESLFSVASGAVVSLFCVASGAVEAFSSVA